MYVNLYVSILYSIEVEFTGVTFRVTIIMYIVHHNIIIKLQCMHIANIKCIFQHSLAIPVTYVLVPSYIFSNNVNNNKLVTLILLRVLYNGGLEPSV